MKILWDDRKNETLISKRGVSFEEVVALLLKDQIIDILKNPVRPEQFYFVVNLKNYTHVVPFLINDRDEIVLKTIFPSRKLHKKYGGIK